MHMFSRIDTIIVRVRDLGRATQWYRENLRLAPSFEDPHERLAVLATAEGSSLTLWELKAGELLAPSDAAGSYPIFAVADAPGAHQLLRAQGVELEPLAHAEGVCFFGFRDLDGNRLEACQVVD